MIWILGKGFCKESSMTLVCIAETMCLPEVCNIDAAPSALSPDCEERKLQVMAVVHIANIKQDTCVCMMYNGLTLGKTVTFKGEVLGML